MLAYLFIHACGVLFSPANRGERRDRRRFFCKNVVKHSKRVGNVAFSLRNWICWKSADFQQIQFLKEKATFPTLLECFTTFLQKNLRRSRRSPRFAGEKSTPHAWMKRYASISFHPRMRGTFFSSESRRTPRSTQIFLQKRCKTL